MKLISRIGTAGLLLFAFISLGHAEIIDNTDPGFSTVVGDWPTTTYDSGYYGSNYSYNYSGDGDNKATWTFTVSAGRYELSAYWPSDGALASNATYTVINNGAEIGTQVFNQRLNGSQFNAFDTTYTVDAGTLEVVLSDIANGYVIADAVQAVWLSPTASLTANPDTITEGLSSTLTWTTTNADTVTIEPGIGTVAANDSTPVWPTATTTYTITATGPSGSTATDTATVTVEPPSSDPVIIDNTDPGFSTVVGDWPTTTYDSGYYGSNYSYNYPGDGDNKATWTFSVSAGRYELSAYWPSDGALASNATYTVINNGAEIGTQVFNQQLNGSQFNAFDTTYTVDAGTLEVVLSDIANGYIIADAVQAVWLSPATETDCTDDIDNDNDEQTDCDDTDCSADPFCQPPTASLTANPETITEGLSSTLNWTTTNADTVTIEPGGPVEENGEATVWPTATTTYTITATSPSGSTATDTATVTVEPPSSSGTDVGGTISTDTTWTVGGSPYIVTSDITIMGTDGVTATLTIEEGVVVKFNQNRYMNIGASAGGQGALVARGTDSNPITFTSNQTDPDAGDWYGIRFLNTTNDATTVMEHCVVEYGGSSSGQLYIYQASPTFRNVTIKNSGTYGAYVFYSEPVFENCTFSGNLNYDLYYRGTHGGSVTGCTINSGINQVYDSTVNFSGNTINQNNAFPIKLYADSVGGVSSSTLYNVDETSFIQVNGGTVSHDAVWTAAMPYTVTGNLVVKGADGTDDITTLEILEGAHLKFSPNLYINIGAATGGQGALVAQGAATNPITFTSSQANPAAGDWYGIKILNTSDDATTRLENCVVEYSGKSGYSTTGAVHIQDAAPTLTKCTFNDNSYGAVRIHDASPTLTNCTFNNSNYYDLYYYGTVGGTVSGCTLNSGIYMQIASPVNFTGNTFNYNNEYPISVYADNVHGLVNGNTFANLDAASYLKVSYGNVTRDATWTSVIPFQIQSNLTVQGTDGADAITTLNIEPGATLRFETNIRLSVGAASGDPGALVAHGTADNPIAFTSNQATPAPGDWYGIWILNTSDDATTRLENCVVEYSGKSGYTVAAAVQVADASPALINCTFNHNYDYDLKYSGTVGGMVSGSTINSGIKVEVDSPVNFTGNTFNYNNNYPFLSYADNVHNLVNGNTYNNLDAASYLKVNYGNVTRDATWTSVIPVQIQSNVTVQGTDGTDGVTTLTIAPGARLKFRNNGLNIGASTGAPGALIAQGTSDQMILFTSNNSVPAPDNWSGITFAATASEGSVIDHCVIEYAGSDSNTIYLSDRKISLTNSILRNNAGTALYAAGTNCSDASIRCNTFEGNQTGIYVTGNAVPNIEYNNFINNSYCGLRSYGYSITADNNWWNDADGPNQSGDKTMGDVNAAPWSTEPNQCSSPGDNSPPYEPIYPSPVDNAVRVDSSSAINLTWTGGDPDAQDKVVYDVYIGTAADTLAIDGQDVVGAGHVINNPTPGITYFWQVVAKDNRGAATTGPVWRFTASGNDPDLTIGDVVTDPAGNLQNGQNVIIRATIQNIGTGPMVDSFAVDFKVDGSSIGTPAVTDIMLAGQSAVVSVPWSYAGGNPTVEIQADSQQSVAETDEQNNQYSGFLYDIADMTAPVITSTIPAGSAYIQQVDTITVTLADTQSEIDDGTVIASFGVANSNQQSVPGTVTEANDTFTFTPDTSHLADGTYTVSLTPADILGNTQNYSFVFTVDSQPPAKPVITGGTASNKTIQPRPAQNTADQFVVQLTGTREADTAVLINGVERVALGDAPWSVEIELQAGANAFEARLKDRAGNIGEAEWVDIDTNTGNTIELEYDSAGRVKRIY